MGIHMSPVAQCELYSYYYYYYYYYYYSTTTTIEVTR